MVASIQVHGMSVGNFQMCIPADMEFVETVAIAQRHYVAIYVLAVQIHVTCTGGKE